MRVLVLSLLTLFAPQDRAAPADPGALAVPRRPVARKDYVDLVRPFAKGFEAGPDRGTYGARHALPALAVFALEGDAKLAGGIQKTLRHYGDWVKSCVEKEKGVFSMEGGTLLAFYARELRRRKLMTPEDEDWFRDLLLTLRRYQCAWRPGDGLWRGSHHRSQCQGSLHALAAAFYPDEPEARAWKAYADRVWDDWWSFRDVGINDTGYFYSSLNTVLRTAELLDRKEVFSDPGSRKIFDRILLELTPDGGAVPYGASGGYHSSAGARIFALELAARHTRDGRYRWGAHRIMNFGQARGFSSTHHHLQALSLEDIALASLVCDDTVEPVPPDGGSTVLSRPEIVRLTGRQSKERFPDAGGVDCDMFMTPREMPHKLVFRAGWEPGDLYLLVEAYPRHDPLNPTAIVGFERGSAGFAEMTSEKFVSRENAVAISDLSGTATFLGKKVHRGEKGLPLGWAGMETSVPDFTDRALATHARVRVTNYMGFEADHQREFLFVKNRWVLVRDETEFRDAFRASVGPAWNTQHVGSPRGEHWMNTWFSAHHFQSAKVYDVPPWDLLVWYAPRAGARLSMSERPVDTPAASRVVPTRYAWEGEVSPGSRVQFVQVYLPHAPAADATPLAAGIEALADEPGLAAVRIALGGRVEIGILNPSGDPRAIDTKGSGRLVTDAKAAYLELEGDVVRRALAVRGTALSLGPRELFRGGERKDFEKTGN
jgi:hypothetical protein